MFYLSWVFQHYEQAAYCANGAQPSKQCNYTYLWYHNAIIKLKAHGLKLKTKSQRVLSSIQYKEV